nr:unnamed protein product [Callosobruchus analis]
METTVGWTLMGKIPTYKLNHCDIVTVLIPLSMDANISDLWELETIGIKEPTDKNTKEEMAEAAKDVFLENVCVDDDHRYVVYTTPMA